MASVIDDDHVGGVQEALATTSGRGEDKMFVDADGEISRGAGGVAQAMNPATEAGELSAKIRLRGVEGRFEVSGFELNRLLGHVLSHWIAALLFFWGSDSFLIFRPTASEMWKRRPAVRPPTTLWCPTAARPMEAMQPHWEQSGSPPNWHGVMTVLRSAETVWVVRAKIQSAGE